MKTCVSTYSFGHYCTDLGLRGVIDRAAAMGFEGIEFVTGDQLNALSDAELRDLGEYAAAHGLARVSLCVDANFARADADATEAEIARVCAQIDRARALGVSMVRHDAANQPGDRKYGIGYDDCLPRVAAAIRRVTEYAEGLGIRTMTENHGFFSQDAARVEKLINTVAHPNFGALIDLGNFMCADEAPWKSTGILAPYAFHVHAKDFFLRSGMETDPGNGWFRTRGGDYLRGTIVGHGDAHVAQSLFVLQDSGYDGYVSIEFEGCEDNLLGITWGLENLHRYLGR